MPFFIKINAGVKSQIKIINANLKNFHLFFKKQMQNCEVYEDKNWVTKKKASMKNVLNINNNIRKWIK